MEILKSSRFHISENQYLLTRSGLQVNYQALVDAINYILLTVSQETPLSNYIRGNLLTTNTCLGVSYFCLRPCENDYK